MLSILRFKRKSLPAVSSAFGFIKIGQQANLFCFIIVIILIVIISTGSSVPALRKLYVLSFTYGDVSNGDVTIGDSHAKGSFLEVRVGYGGLCLHSKLRNDTSWTCTRNGTALIDESPSNDLFDLKIMANLEKRDLCLRHHYTLWLPDKPWRQGFNCLT